jgi:hypothetical protein
MSFCDVAETVTVVGRRLCYQRGASIHSADDRRGAAKGRLDLFLGDNMMSDPSDFTVKISNDRDIIISKPEAGFKVTYRREVYYPMLIASDVLRNDFDESKITLLAQAWKLALDKAKSLGWLDYPEQKRKEKGRPRRT